MSTGKNNFLYFFIKKKFLYFPSANKHKTSLIRLGVDVGKNEIVRSEEWCFGQKIVLIRNDYDIKYKSSVMSGVLGVTTSSKDSEGFS